MKHDIIYCNFAIAVVSAGFVIQTVGSRAELSNANYGETGQVQVYKSVADAISDIDNGVYGAPSEPVNFYLRLILPAIYAAIDVLVKSEVKYGRGLKLNPKMDGLKAITHMGQSLKGEENEDPNSHAAASLVRAIKFVVSFLKGSAEYS